MPRALLLTIGTGDVAELETSLFAPLLLSIRQGEWARVVLLPSLVTGSNAEEIRRRLAAQAITIAPLPTAGAESDADACFDHFDRTIEALRAEGFAPGDIVADFTRGTKAMSAALVLAAVRHGVPVLRYVAGTQRDQRGMVVPGSEVLRETRTARATARRRLDLARNLAEHASFGAALSLLPDPDHKLAAVGWDSAERDALRTIRPLLAWFAAWDRLDYEAAETRSTGLPKPETLPAAWRPLCPSLLARGLVKRLAATPRSDRLLAIDLLANAKRRVAQGQHEDALVRLYNIVERIARARLTDRGVTAEGRADTIDRLVRAGDPIGRALRDLEARHPLLRAGARNNSILVHGHDAVGATNPQAWGSAFLDLEEVLRQDAATHGAEAAFATDLATAGLPGPRSQS
jgi:hypothetical protein